VPTGSFDAFGELSMFGEASSDLCAARALQQRTDRKYLTTVLAVEPLLARLVHDYAVVHSAGALAASYRTRYFDTSSLDMYHDHRRGRRPRHKVRVRQHLDRKLSFLEVKTKGRNDRTVKARRLSATEHADLDTDARMFVGEHCSIDPRQLQPQLWVAFKRVTLVGRDVEERMTLDYDLEFWNDERRVRLPHVMVAEVKQARYSNHSPSVSALRELHVREAPMSKYCFATATVADVSAHTFKPMIRSLERLSA
jgi:hypothetical protein